MVKLVSKTELIAIDKDNEKSDIDNYLEILNSRLSDGLPFGEAKFTISFPGDGKNIKAILDRELNEAGYEFTSNYDSFGINEGYSENDSWSRADYNVSLGEKKTFHCTNCHGVLENELGVQSTYQFDNALWLGFFGGYGMFVESGDFASENPPVQLIKTGASFEAVLCHDCAHKLCDLFPGIGDLINPYNSHAHSGEYHKAHPEHYGWDYGS